MQFKNLIHSIENYNNIQKLLNEIHCRIIVVHCHLLNSIVKTHFDQGEYSTLVIRF